MSGGAAARTETVPSNDNAMVVAEVWQHWQRRSKLSCKLVTRRGKFVEFSDHLVFGKFVNSRDMSFPVVTRETVSDFLSVACAVADWTFV